LRQCIFILQFFFSTIEHKKKHKKLLNIKNLLKLIYLLHSDFERINIQIFLFAFLISLIASTSIYKCDFLSIRYVLIILDSLQNI